MGVIPAHRTKWDERSRVNVESDLEFNGASKFFESDLDTRYNFGSSDFSVFFNCESISDIGINALLSFFVSNTNTLQVRGDSGGDEFQIFAQPSNRLIIGNSVHKYSGYPSSSLNRKASFIIVKKGINFEFNINGKTLTLSSIQNPLLLTDEFNLNLGKLIISASNDLAANSTNIKISSICIFNKSLTQEEISYLHIQGGLVPKSAQESCVSHYPLTQRQYPKASAGFIIKHPQFALGDLVAFDVVEQYNYSKITPLVANHGKIVNFTDAEAGSDGLAPIGTSVKDFYLKNNLLVYAAPVQPLAIDNIEIKSLFPPLVNAINVNGGVISITGSGDGIGLFIKTEVAIANLSNLVSGLSAISEFRVNGNVVANEAALVDAVNEQELIHLHISATITNPVIQSFNGHIGLAYISNDAIYIKDIYKNANNLLLANPFINDQSKFNNYNIFNELININEVEDQIGSSNATTLATAFIDINELR